MCFYLRREHLKTMPKTYFSSIHPLYCIITVAKKVNISDIWNFSGTLRCHISHMIPEFEGGVWLQFPKSEISVITMLCRQKFILFWLKIGSRPPSNSGIIIYFLGYFCREGEIPFHMTKLLINYYLTLQFVFVNPES